MKILGDWKWHAALAVFVLFTVLVIWLPAPQATPAATATAVSPIRAADMLPARPNPSADERDDMLQYTVQDDDTVAKIARLFVISEDELRRANSIPGDDEFTPGRMIWIPVK